MGAGEVEEYVCLGFEERELLDETTGWRLGGYFFFGLKLETNCFVALEMMPVAVGGFETVVFF